MSVSGINRGCEPEVTAEPLPWRVGGEPQRGAEMQSSGERAGGTPGDHKGMKAEEDLLLPWWCEGNGRCGEERGYDKHCHREDDIGGKD